MLNGNDSLRPISQLAEFYKMLPKNATKASPFIVKSFYRKK